MTDDMKGRIKRLAALVENDECHWNMGGPPESESDCVDVLVSDLRALLLDYQQRGRALERIINACDAGITKRHIRDYAAEVLTLKGKSHDR
jgi:hypothetical protein